MGLAGTLAAAPASASLILQTFQQYSGTGLGAVNTILTFQNTPAESGCVSFGGRIGSTLDPVTGICTGSSADVRTGASQTQTRTLGQVGVTSASDFSLIFNAVEPAGNFIALNDARVAFYNSVGGLLFESMGLLCQTIANGPLVPAGSGGCLLNQTASGTGNSGYLLVLDAPQQLLATSSGAFSSSTNVIGLSATASLTAGGNETFFVNRLDTVTPTPPPGRVPEPGSLALLGAALGAIGLLRRRKR